MTGDFSARHLAKQRALAQTFRRRLWGQISQDRNIVGTGFGQRIAQNAATGEPAVVVYVAKKIPQAFLPPSRHMPRRHYVGHDCIEVDVIETGPIYAQAFTARERPAPCGISIGHPNITAGTLGCLARDNTDKSLCILSNNHVIADQNNANVGDRIIQPGTADGGSPPADDIAALKRFIPINFAGSNTVDCAIAQVLRNNLVVDQMKDNLMPIPSPRHPAVGLLFAGSCNRTIMNPIDKVQGALNITLTGGAGATVAAGVDMNVEKVGRTTEYTTSTITEIDLTVSVTYDGGAATFTDQIATAWMSSGGDSGSIVCRGGEGGSEDRCGCSSASAAATVLGTRASALETEQLKSFRDRYLGETLLGRWLVNIFYLNEETSLQRLEAMEIRDADRSYAQRLFKKYRAEVQKTLANPDESKQRLSEAQLRDAKAAVGRLKRYLSREEAAAADKLMNLGSKAKGKTVKQGLAMLNDKRLFAQVQEIVSSVPSIVTPEVDRKARHR